MEHNILGNPCEEDNSGLRSSRRLSFDQVEDMNNLKPNEVEDDKLNIASGSGCNIDSKNNGDTTKPEIGMEFDSEQHAYDFYNEYARRVGFSIRKDWKNKNSAGVVRRRKLCCSREGIKREDRRYTVRHQRDPTRVDCKAHIMISLQQSRKYKIYQVHLEHNHHCTPSKSSMFRSQKKVIGTRIVEANMASSVDTVSKKTFDLMSTQAEGHTNVGFIPIDIKNYIRSKRMRAMEKGGAGDILQYLQKMVVEDPGFVYSIQLDAEEQITNIFWADSEMVSDYNVFGDVVCFDTTYRTDNQARPFAPFVGLNHHKETILFGAALMYDETTESFEWVFKTFLNAMSGRQPKTILTDQDTSMANAITLSLPNTYHRICVWHVYQNATKYFSHAFSGAKSFGADFKKLVFDYDDEEDFLNGWENMLDKYRLRENAWLQKLFNEKEKWALVYKTTFCADMKSTQMSEGLNCILRHRLNNSHSLVDFFEHFVRVVYDGRKVESEADFKMTQSISQVIAEVPLLIFARNVYTPEIFKSFQEEYRKGMAYRVKLSAEFETLFAFTVTCPQKKREYTVTCDKGGLTISCTCKKFEFTGILCGHALRVFDRMEVEQVPDKYILKRWCKHAKIENLNNSHRSILFGENVTLSKRYKELMRLSMKLSTWAAENEQAFKVAMEGLHNVSTKVEEVFSQLPIKFKRL